MVQDGVAWFGEMTTKTVTVTGAERASQLISSNFPTSMSSGQTYSVSIRMKNTGTTSWTESGQFRLGAAGDSTGDAAKFGPGRIGIPAGTTVAPGQEHTFTFTITAPVPGTYNPSYRMVQDGVAWFGATTTKTVTVTGTLRNSQVISSNFPTARAGGETYSV